MKKILIIAVSIIFILLTIFFINPGTIYRVLGYENIDTEAKIYNLVSKNFEEVSVIINDIDNQVKLKKEFDKNYILEIQNGDVLKVKGDVAITPLSEIKYDDSITEYKSGMYQISQNIPVGVFNINQIDDNICNYKISEDLTSFNNEESIILEEEKQIHLRGTGFIEINKCNLNYIGELPEVLQERENARIAAEQEELDRIELENAIANASVSRSYTPGTLVVGTYNVLAQRYADNDKKYFYEPWSIRKDWVAQNISNHAPDLIALQELQDVNALSSLMGQLPSNYQTIGSYSVSNMEAIVYNTDRLTLINSGVKSFVAPGSRGKGYVYGVFIDNVTNAKFLFVSTHVMPIHLGLDIQQLEIEELGNDINIITSQNGIEKVIIGGDLNANGGSTANTRLGQITGTTCITSDTPTHPSANIYLDYICTNTGVVDKWIENAWSDEPRASDHIPVYTRVNIK